MLTGNRNCVRVLCALCLAMLCSSVLACETPCTATMGTYVPWQGAVGGETQATYFAGCLASQGYSWWNAMHDCVDGSDLDDNTGDCTVPNLKDMLWDSVNVFYFCHTGCAEVFYTHNARVARSAQLASLGYGDETYNYDQFQGSDGQLRSAIFVNATFLSNRSRNSKQIFWFGGCHSADYFPYINAGLILGYNTSSDWSEQATNLPILIGNMAGQNGIGTARCSGTAINLSGYTTSFKKPAGGTISTTTHLAPTITDHGPDPNGCHLAQNVWVSFDCAMDSSKDPLSVTPNTYITSESWDGAHTTYTVVMEDIPDDAGTFSATVSATNARSPNNGVMMDKDGQNHYGQNFTWQWTQP